MPRCLWQTAAVSRRMRPRTTTWPSKSPSRRSPTCDESGDAAVSHSRVSSRRDDPAPTDRGAGDHHMAWTDILTRAATHVSFGHVLLFGEIRPPTKGPNPEDSVSVRALAGSWWPRAAGWGPGRGPQLQAERSWEEGELWSRRGGRPHTVARALVTLLMADLL